MNYQYHYTKLIQKAKFRSYVEGYIEEHHIKPRSFGGSNNPDNIVKLTAREHFIAHRLLAKIYPNSGMVHAIWWMANTYKIKISSKTYEALRREHANRVSQNENLKYSNSINFTGKGNPMYGKTHTDSAKARISKCNLGKTAWNKGLNINDPRVKAYSEKRNLNMEYKIGRDASNFKNINEELLISLYLEKKSFGKIGFEMGINRKLVSRRVKLLKAEGKIK